MDADSAERSRKRGRPSAPIATAAQQTMSSRSHRVIAPRNVGIPSLWGEGMWCARQDQASNVMCCFCLPTITTIWTSWGR